MGNSESVTPTTTPPLLELTPTSKNHLREYPKYSPHEISIGQNITFPQQNPLYRGSTLSKEAQKQQEFKFIREHCKKLSFFTDLPEEKIKDIVSKFRVGLSTDQWLFKEGSNATYFFIIVEGHVQIVKNGYLIRNLGAGDYFGQMALLYGIKRSSSVRVVKQYRTRNIYYCLHKKHFLEAILFPTPQKTPYYLSLTQSHPCFQYLTYRDQVHLAEKSTKIKFQANERILTKYDQPFALFVIDSGKARLNFRNKRSMEIGSKCIFGYYGSDEIWCSAMCLEQSVIYAIGKDSVDKVLKTKIKYLYLWHKVYYTLISSEHLTDFSADKIYRLTNQFTYKYIRQRIKPICLCESMIDKIFIPISMAPKEEKQNKTKTNNTQSLFRCLYSEANTEKRNGSATGNANNGSASTTKLNINVSGVKNKRKSRISQLSALNANLNDHINTNTNPTNDNNSNGNNDQVENLNGSSGGNSSLSKILSKRSSKIKLDAYNVSTDMSSDTNPAQKTNGNINPHAITNQPIGLQEVITHLKSSKNASSNTRRQLSNKYLQRYKFRYKFDYVGERGNYYSTISVSDFLKFINDQENGGWARDKRGKEPDSGTQFAHSQEICKYRSPHFGLTHTIMKQNKFGLYYDLQTNTDPSSYDLLLKNIKIYLSLSSPHIQSAYCYREYPNHKLELVKQVVRGKSIHTFMKRIGVLPHHIGKFYIVCMVAAIRYLHSRGVVCEGLNMDNWVVGDCDGYLWLVGGLFTDCEGSIVKQNSNQAQQKDRSTCGKRGDRTSCQIKQNMYSQNIRKLGYLGYQILMGHQLERVGNGDEIEFPANFKHRESKQLIQHLVLFKSEEYCDRSWEKIAEMSFFKNVEWKLIENKEMEAPIVPGFMSMSVDEQ